MARIKVDPLSVKPKAQVLITRIAVIAFLASLILSVYSSCMVTLLMSAKKDTTDPVKVVTISSRVKQVAKDYLFASLTARQDDDPMNVKSAVNNRSLPDLPGENTSGYSVSENDIYLRSIETESTGLVIDDQKVLAHEWLCTFGAKVAAANSDTGSVKFFLIRVLQVGNSLTVLSLPSPVPSDPLKKLALQPVYANLISDDSALSVSMKNFVTNYFVSNGDQGHSTLWRVYVSEKFDTTAAAPDEFTNVTISSILSVKPFMGTTSPVGSVQRVQINLQGFNGDETFSVFSVFVTASLSKDSHWLVDSLDDYISLK